jgi:hypothetical protein
MRVRSLVLGFACWRAAWRAAADKTPKQPKVQKHAVKHAEGRQTLEAARPRAWSTRAPKVAKHKVSTPKMAKHKTSKFKKHKA